MAHNKMRIQGSVSEIQTKISLPVTKKNQIISKQICKEAFPCIRLEASYMAETAVAIPFFTGFLMLLLFFFQIMTVEREVGNALVSSGRELSILCCQQQEETTENHLTAKALLFKNLPKDSLAEEFIKGGRMGISLLRSDLSGNFIRLKADYKIRFPIGLFGKRDISMTQKIVCRKWTGKSFKDPSEEIVFVAKTGSVYHRSADCAYLRPSVKRVSASEADRLRNADGGKYYSCGACMKGKNTNTIMVYITKYGNRYHGKETCSRIRRTSFAVHLSETKGKKSCSKCGKE